MDLPVLLMRAEDAAEIEATPADDEAARERSRRAPRPRRRFALLGGTTTWGDAFVAGRYVFSRRLLRGGAIEAYEREFAAHVGVRYAYTFAAGRVGLYGVLRALGIGAGDEVLLQVPTHVVVPNAVRYTGAEPVYVDCDPESYTIDVDDLERRITPRTKALVLQHTFGIPADLGRVLEVVRRHNLELIEDCVHSLGAEYDGQPLGSFGRAAFFSTEETKTISTTMGGVLVTDDPELAEKVSVFQERCAWPQRSLARRYLVKLALYHALTQPRVHRYTRALYERFGRRNPLPQATTPEEQRGDRPAEYEQRMSNGQCAVGLRQLRRLTQNVSHRRALSNEYRERLGRSGFRAPRVPPNAQAAFVRYPVAVRDRSTAVAQIAPHAVLGMWFTSVLEEAFAPEVAGYVAGSCPNAERSAGNLVNLPTHLRVQHDDVARLVEALAGATPPAEERAK
jgi:perosamine synthetase